MYENIEALARKAGEIMLSARLSDTEPSEKTSNSDIVTKYDFKIQEFLISELSRLYPSAEFVGEEGETDGSITEKVNKEAFIIDPIDGTINFVRNMRKSCVSIAYAKGSRIVYGCCYIPYCDELYTAELGKGAYLNGRRIFCSDRPIEHALVAIGTSPYYKKEAGDATFAIMRALFERAMDIRRMGSAVHDLLDVASGRTDIYVELMLSPWDFAAASLVASESGACVSRVCGKELLYDRRMSVVAASKPCYDFFMSCPEIEKYRLGF